MADPTVTVGFASPIAENALSKRRSVGIAVFATIALAVSLTVAAAAVSIGAARAQILHHAPPTAAAISRWP